MEQDTTEATVKFIQELLQQGISVSDVSSKGLPKLITDTMYHHKQENSISTVFSYG